MSYPTHYCTECQLMRCTADKQICDECLKNIPVATLAIAGKSAIYDFLGEATNGFTNDKAVLKALHALVGNSSMRRLPPILGLDDNYWRDLFDRLDKALNVQSP